MTRIEGPDPPEIKASSKAVMITKLLAKKKKKKWKESKEQKRDPSHTMMSTWAAGR